MAFFRTVSMSDMMPAISGERIPPPARMIAIAEGTCMVRLLQVMLRFYHHESCGQCTPCREGCGWIERILNKIVEGNGSIAELDQAVGIRQ